MKALIRLPAMHKLLREGAVILCPNFGPRAIETQIPRYAKRHETHPQFRQEESPADILNHQRCLC